MKLKKLGILLFPSFLAAGLLSAILSAGAKDVAEKKLPAEPTIKVSQADVAAVQGYWKLDINVRGQTRSGSRSNYQIMAYFNQTGSDLSGQFVETNNNACKDTSISGTVNGDKVNWIVSYTGSCCGGARMKFEGVRRSANLVEGKLSPVGSTPANCTLWWADVVTSKQNNYRR